MPVAVIAAWLGHADPAFTLRTYLHCQDDALRGAAEARRRGRDVGVTWELIPSSTSSGPASSRTGGS